ncbi:GRIP1-associated protein 1 isoform X4 [Acanthochromis polyacanthus]|uniref:GRIP1-associated protein 1 isoform X4 n=1 Tax=Acanthochromis polyacanthus TaxID=80966 RepID=UPI0022348147|nr:GRIP1-associated protein 1 isoform X4 [Acanthochromis polyacanthus]
MAMSQALSEEEFHRMQAQLLELRTQNYQLSDDLRKNSAELNSVRQKNVVLERDFIKAQKALNKSKKAQEVEALLSENEMLQGKLHSQEEDFRLQNSTLMTELSKLCTQIEQLEQENQGLKEGGGASAASPPPNPASSPVDGELLRLQAENSTLQKQMKALQERHDKELQRLAVAQGNQGITTETDGSAGANGVSDVPGGGEEPAGGANERLDQTDSQPTDKQLHELEMKLSTEQEEKRLLREQIQHLEASKQGEITKLQEEITKLTDKLKKKQESFQRLQTEKEVLYNDSRTKIDEINQRKEEELKASNIRIQKLQTDLMAANQTTAELREQLQSKEKEHEVALHTLKDQVANQSAVSQEQVDNILQENDALRTNLAALEQENGALGDDLCALEQEYNALRTHLCALEQIQTVKTQEMNLLREQQEALTAELQQRRTEQENLLAQRDDLDSQLQESSFANRKLLEQLTEEGQEKEKLLRELDEAKKTAEKRKSMLDDMAIQLNQEKSDHKEALSDLKLQHEKEVLGVRARYEKELRGLHEDKNRSEEEIRQQLRDEKARSKELESLQPRLEELQAQVQSMEGTKGWFERRLKEAEESIEQNSLQHQEEVERLQKEHSVQLQEKQEEMERLKQQLVEVEKQKDEHVDAIGKLKQEIKDTVDGQRILEKKGSAALKDLKRQLQLERKRADKLQERLQEILTNSKTRTGLEELVLSEINSPSRTQQTGDSSSVSSFSYRDMMKETQPTNQNKSGGGSPQSQRPAELSDDEVGELFQRLAEVQQEKWMLEEKVKHLEVSCSSMAEDICRKSAIIETYVMDSRIDVSGSAVGGHGGSQGERGGLGSVLRDLVKPGDENLREMNKKLQNMLEEQLTKNMHLQKDLEVLSQELVRLSKENNPGAAAGSG